MPISQIGLGSAARRQAGPAMMLVGASLIIAGLSVGVASLVALHLLPTGMSLLRNAVSQYGITAYRAG
ncbi:MAG: hypothetical protein M0T79_04170 [Actinomycetota bacterium]|nr:hypothetical protein [Actinomycetota bacterium]